MYKVDFLSSRLSLSAHLSLSTRSEWNMLRASCPSTEQCVEQFTSKAPIAASVDGSRFARRPPSRSVINDLRSSCDSHGSNETPTLFGRAVPSPSVSLCSRTSLGPRSSFSLSSSPSDEIGLQSRLPPLPRPLRTDPPIPEQLLSLSPSLPPSFRWRRSRWVESTYSTWLAARRQTGPLTTARTDGGPLPIGLSLREAGRGPARGKDVHNRGPSS